MVNFYECKIFTFYLLIIEIKYVFLNYNFLLLYNYDLLLDYLKLAMKLYLLIFIN